MKSFEIDFRATAAESGKTKFGGQPDWITTPEWPISNTTGRPMRFICQVNLRDIGLSESEAEMAYLFMTDEEEYVDGTWEPDGGENAIVLQPGHNSFKTEDHATGPTLYEMVEVPGKERLVPKDFMSAVELTEFLENETPRAELEFKNKIGGRPEFLQGEEYPSNEKWDLLLQLDSTSVPFSINFGDAGVGYAFISDDKKRAKFLWQCA